MAKRMAKPRQSVWQSHGKAYGKATAEGYGKATAKRMAKPRLKGMAKPRLKGMAKPRLKGMAKSGLMTQILLRKSPQNTLRANIIKRWLFVRGIVRIATWVRRQAYGCYTGDFIGLKGSVKLRLQSIF